MDGALLTDLYQLTMLQAYFDRGMRGTATFEFFVRRLPPRRNFLVAAGLEQVLQYLESLCFAPSEQGEPLLHQVMAGGVRMALPPALAASRELAARQLASLPPALRELAPVEPPPVAIAPSVSDLAAAVDERIARSANHGG